jgi:hypothetical protein
MATGPAGATVNGGVGAATTAETFRVFVNPLFVTVTGTVTLPPTPTLPKLIDPTLMLKHGPGSGGVRGPPVKMVTDPPTAGVTSAEVVVNIFTFTLPLPSKYLSVAEVHNVARLLGHENVMVVPAPNCS